jgi:pimeloyl-ACP methyl ester carboxylesterase
VVLVPCWGQRHPVQATAVHLEGAAHFPAVEVPQIFFERLQGLLAEL